MPTVVLACALSVLAGCSSDADTPAREVELGTSQPSEPSPSPTESEDPAGEADDEGHEIYPGRVAVKDDERQAVADAWIAYWQTRFDAFAGPELDPAALGEVATGKAAEQVIAYVRYLQDEKLYTRGDAVIAVGAVRITGRQATVRSCAQNWSVDVKQGNDRPTEPLNPFYTFRGVLSGHPTAGWWRTRSA
ncbi:hypothetical protein [Nocardioides iriomotensis]|uniref:Uncharacterized protein n=1 Tax=Nocardioides iriomotensis TaxID=715784 RepID=A0A4Q5J2U5_9ACTN|nr:hypothetical protein [Nocardioides iriomotensis]RYU12754.1 hypothetical protein ETU37_07200 [Nocardioides iriomotensis]